MRARPHLTIPSVEYKASIAISFPSASRELVILRDDKVDAIASQSFSQSNVLSRQVYDSM